MNKLKPILTVISVLIISAAVGYALAAWQEPGQIPPEGNVSAPINVGPDTQEKLGSIVASGFLGHEPGYGVYPDPGATSALGGNLTVGEGITLGGVYKTAWPTADTSAIVAIPSGTTGSYSLDWNTIQVCQFGTCCPPWEDCDGDGKTYQAQTDCNENCNTCFVDSSALTESADGLDQNCDGSVDNLFTKNLLFITSTLYNGNLGGRSGADTKCNSDTNKPAACGTTWAFISVSDTDEIRDMTTTKAVDPASVWYWRLAETSALAGGNLAALLSGQAASVATSVGYGNYWYWTGSDSSGAIHAQNCNGFTSGAYPTGGARGYTNSLSHVIYGTYEYCSDAAAGILCACKTAELIYR